MSNQYDRQNPNLEQLLERLKLYSQIDYGTEAYPLSAAEAAALVAGVGRLEAEVEGLNRELIYCSQQSEEK